MSNRKISVGCRKGDTKFTEVIRAGVRLVSPVTGHEWKEPLSVFIATSPQVLMYTDNIPFDPSLLWAAQSLPFNLSHRRIF